MIDDISLWSHALAAALFGMLAAWSAQKAVMEKGHWALAIACTATAAFAMVVAAGDLQPRSIRVGEGLVSVAWLGYMYALWRIGGGVRSALTLAALYGTVMFVTILATTVSAAPYFFDGSPRLLNTAFFGSIVLSMISTIGSLMLVHNLYTAATTDARSVIRMPMIGLAIYWAYDLNLLTIAYLSGEWSIELSALRGLALAIIAPLFGLAMAQTGRTKIRLSRTATFQSLSLVAIGGYLVAMVLVTSIIDAIASDYARMAQVIFVFGSSIAALFLLPSERFRAWFRVKLSKHLFQHRFDYRAEWLRFTDTIGRPSHDGASLDIRIIQAVADITESPGGALLIPDESGQLVMQAKWNWKGAEIPGHAASAELGQFFLKTGRITSLDTIRATLNEAKESALIPEWLLGDASAWALVPLVHFERLAAIVILQRPVIDRTFDWEDFDLLRVVGRQLASYLAEARSQETLASVQQFDEFNRRFAFIMHDIKNLVSQLTLVTRNAERHAGNPEFQADMIATLKSSTARMNEMLARLSQHNKVRIEEPVAAEAGPMVQSVTDAKRLAHPIVIGGMLDLFIVADPARLQQALSHLVQNAIEASPTTEPVCVMIKRVNDQGVIEIADKGHGMSTHFIRHSLFKPFSSTKPSGFGIGAFESQELIVAMNGRLEVTSREGEGTTFRIILPLARGSDVKIEDYQVKAA
jgi:putative PEP-CTERM system histidine kinase